MLPMLVDKLFSKNATTQKKRKISKTRTPYNIRDAKHKPSCMRAQAGLTFFSRKARIYFEERHSGG